MRGPHGTVVVGMLGVNNGIFGTYLTLFYNENRARDKYTTAWWVPGEESWHSGDYFDADTLGQASRRLVSRFLNLTDEVIYAP